MYKRLAVSLTNTFMNKKIVTCDKRDICEYGFEILISNIVYIFIFIITTIITNTLLESLIFSLGLLIIRKTAGGHHASSYIACHILFAFNHILFIISIKVLPQTLLYGCICLLLSFAITMVAVFAPVDHKNKPFIKSEYVRYKTISRISCIILLIILLSYITLHATNRATDICDMLYFSFSFGTASATVSLLSAKIIRYKERGTIK